MEKHIQLVGILNIVYRSLMLIGSFIVLAIASMFPYLFDFICRHAHGDCQDIPFGILHLVPIILGAIGVLILIVSIAGIIGGIGVLKRKEWGRVTLLVVSFFNLLHIPLGTVLGVYTIWVLFNSEIIRIFNPPAEPAKQ